MAPRGLSAPGGRAAAALAVLLTVAPGRPLPLAAQQPATGAARLREAMLVVERAGAEIGRERVVARRGPDAPGRVGVTTFAVAARYADDSTTVELTATLDVGPAGEAERFVLEGRTPEGPMRVLAAALGPRLVVRTLVAGTESARELPASGAVVLLDEHLLGLLAVVAGRVGPTPARLVGVHPRTGRRLDFTARREANRVELTGGLAGSIVLAPDGLPERIELPASGLSARRVPR